MDVKLVMTLVCLLGAIPTSGAGIVRFRNAYQSSTDDFPRSTAPKAMDGNQESVAITGYPISFGSSGISLGSSWWVGRLQKTTSIGKILIYTTPFAVSNGNFNGFKVEIRTSENEPWRVCKPLHKLEMQSPSTGVVRCDGGPMTAKEVRLTVQRAKLFLAEVEVFEAGSGKVDGGWGGWGSYGKCKTLGSKPCGNGFEKRTRACNKPSPANGGKPCTGVSAEFRRCQRSCPSKPKPNPSKPKPNPSNPGTKAPSVPGTYRIRYDPWGFGEDAQLKCVEDANEYRRRHQDTPDFKFDRTLAADAQRYADKMANGAPFAHDTAELRRKSQGENLAAYTDSSGRADLQYCQFGNKGWWGEILRYDFTPSGGPPRYFGSCGKIHGGDPFMGPASGKGVGHFFQIAWDSVQKVGFGVAYGRGKIFVVARYSPQRGHGLTAGKHIHPLKTTPDWQQWYKEMSGNVPCVRRGR